LTFNFVQPASDDCRGRQSFTTSHHAGDPQSAGTWPAAKTQRSKPRRPSGDNRGRWRAPGRAVGRV